MEKFNGMLNHGIKTQEELLNERSRASMDRSRSMAKDLGFRHASDRGAAQVGAGLGALLGNKLLGTKGLDPEALKQAKILEETNAAFNALKVSSPEFAALSHKEKAMEYEKLLADSADRNGDVALAAKISQQRASRHMADKKQQLEFDLLEGRVAKQTRDKAVFDTSNNERLAGSYDTFVVPTADGKFDLTNSADNVMSGRVNEKGQLVSKGADGKELISDTFMTLSQATNLQNAITARTRSIKKANGQPGTVADLSFEKKMKLFKSLFPEVKDARTQVHAVSQQMSIMSSLADSFTDMLKDGKDPASVIGTAGNVVDIASNIKGAFRGITAAFVVPMVDDEGKTISAGPPSEKTMKDRYSTEWDSIVVPEASSKTEEEAAKYKASMVELGYAVARANEGGGRLSDQDFKRAMIQLGATAGDPEKLREVIIANLGRGLEGFDRTQKMISGVAESVGLDPASGVIGVYGHSLKKFNEDRASVKEKFKDLGEALTSSSKEKEASAAGVTVPTEDNSVSTSDADFLRSFGATIEGP